MRRLHKEWKKGISVAMTVLLVGGSIQIPAEAKEAEGWLGKNALSVVEKLEPEVKTSVAELSDTDRGQLAKEETVYVIANAEGSPEKLIVSDWLKNAMGSEKLEDTTELTNIVNVKGTESFEQKEGTLGVWDAAGNDIYYQGNIQKELPVDMKVSYELNGSTVSPEELAGKSGSVKIRFDYTNRQKEAVMVGEKEEELYVPFVLLTSMVLDNENFHNIEVSNGKIINDGERTIVMGYAMPGLKDNLDIGSEDFDIEELDIPEYVELTADVTDFELATTLTVATNEIFGDMDIDTQEKMEDLSSDMDELQDAMQELMDGTAELYDGVLELYDGTEELYDGTEELTDGIDELDDGARKLNDGARELDDGAGKLNDGAGELKKGANELYNGIGTLKTGAGSLFAGVKQLSDGLKQITGNDKALNDGAKALYDGVFQMANAQLTALNQAGVPVNVLTQPRTPEEAGSFMKAIQDNQTVIQGLLDNPARVRDMVSAMVGSAMGIDVSMISEQSLEKEEMPVAEQETKEELTQEAPAETKAEEPAVADKEIKKASEEKSSEDANAPAASKDSVAAEETEEKQEEVSQNTESSFEETKEVKNEETLAPVEAEAEETVEEEEIEAADEATGESAEKEVPEAKVQENEAVLVQASPGAADPVQIIGALKEQMIEKTVEQILQTLTMTNGTLELLKGSYQVYAGVGSYIQGVDQIYAGVQELMKNAPALNSGIGALDVGAGKLRDGAKELGDGTSELKNGTSELKNGTSELKDGTGELRDGGQELRDGVEELRDGVIELRDGSEELRDGTVEFNEEGIQKLVDMLDGDLQELSDRFEGVKCAARSYRSFAGISDGVEGNVRFIYKTAGINQE